MLSVKSKPTVQINNVPAYLPTVVKESPRDSLQVTFKMTGILILLIGSHLVFPRLANLKLGVPLFQQSINFSSQDAQIDNTQGVMGEQQLQDFGAPISDRGSGTR